MKLSDIFVIKYGVNLEVINCEIDNRNGILFISRTSNNNGVVTKVKQIEGICPNPAGSISCSAGGSVLSAFVQEKEYYSGRDLYVLIPKDKNMTLEEKLYFCTVISSNKYRYSYGRQANKTLGEIKIPKTIPSWVYKYDIKKLIKKYQTKKDVKEKNIPIDLNIVNWKKFKIVDLFRVGGTKTTSKLDIFINGHGNYPYVTTQSTNNGVEGFYNYFTELGGVLVVDSAVVGYCSYQESNFSASDHVEKLELQNYKLNKYIALFLTTIMNQESYRYSYGRKFSQVRIKDTTIKLPIDKNGLPDWKFMENYIKSLPYSDKI